MRRLLVLTLAPALALAVSAPAWARGGAVGGRWATANGLRVPPAAPEVLDFYARRSPVFLAARFDANAARRQGIAQGQGTPIHVTIPTPDPWVPLRILALGKKVTEP